MRATTLVTALALAASSSAALAKEPAALTPAQLEAMSEDEIERSVAKVVEADADPFAMHCQLALHATELRRRRANSELDYAIALSQGLCAAGKDQNAIVLVELTKAEALAPADAPPETRTLPDMVLIYAALAQKDLAALETHALHIARRNWPEEFRNLDHKLWQFALRELELEAKGRVALEFTRASAFSHLSKEMQGTLAYHAVRPALIAGDTDLAARLALRDPSTYSILGMLIDRDYEAIWPQLAKAAGPRMRLTLDSELAEARSEAAADPDDAKKLAEFVDKLLWSGDNAGVVGAAARIGHSPEAIAAAGEQHGWVLNAEARALDLLGRPAEADTIFERLGTLPPEPERGWVVNFAINRAARLVSQGRWAEALPATELAVGVASKHGSPYAKLVAATNRYCAAWKLDSQKPELADWWLEIEKNWADAPGAAIEVALCKGDRGAAIRFVRDGLENPSTRPSVLQVLQKPGFALYLDAISVREAPRALLDGDPALKALFLKYGRDLPDELMPN